MCKETCLDFKCWELLQTSNLINKDFKLWFIQNSEQLDQDVRLTWERTGSVCTSASRPVRANRSLETNIYIKCAEKANKTLAEQDLYVISVTSESQQFPAPFHSWSCGFSSSFSKTVWGSLMTCTPWWKWPEENKKNKKKHKHKIWLKRLNVWGGFVPGLGFLWHQPSTCGTSRCSSAPAGSSCQTQLSLSPVDDKIKINT